VGAKRLGARPQKSPTCEQDFNSGTPQVMKMRTGSRTPASSCCRGKRSGLRPIRARRSSRSPMPFTRLQSRLLGGPPISSALASTAGTRAEHRRADDSFHALRTGCRGVATATPAGC